MLCQNANIFIFLYHRVSVCKFVCPIFIYFSLCLICQILWAYGQFFLVYIVPSLLSNTYLFPSFGQCLPDSKVGKCTGYPVTGESCSSLASFGVPGPTLNQIFRYIYTETIYLPHSIRIMPFLARTWFVN